MQNKQSEKWENRLFDMVFVTGGLFLLLNLKIIWEGAKRTRPASALYFAAFASPVCALLAYKSWHLDILQYLGLPIGFLRWLYSFGYSHNFFGLLVLTAAAALWIHGISAYTRNRKMEKALSQVGLKNAYGQGLRVICQFSQGEYYEILRLAAPGIGVDKLNAQKASIESAIGREIETIRLSRDWKYCDLVLVKKSLPEFLPYEEINLPLKDARFHIGQSKKGLMQASIADFPHLLIAGTTGGGKSAFFKQTLLGLLESTENLQLYLIDLKGGLEMRPFAGLPNAKVCDNAADAVAILGGVKSEMEKRFTYLKKVKREKIVPGRDPFDRIVIGIDEASVLFAGVSREDEDHEAMKEARFLTEHIAKLSRAAAIHLILATQKVTKETVDTRIQENVSAKMCFKLNTIEGSVRMLGHGKATDLPAIPGRGIWQYGNVEEIVQVPYLETYTLEDRLAAISEAFASEKRKLRQPMLMNETPTKPFWMKSEEKEASREG